MGKKELSVTDKAYISKNPLSQALRVHATDWLYCSGQVGIDPKTGKLTEGGIEAETVQILDNLKAVLEAGGSSMANVVKTTVFLTDLGDAPVMNRVYKTYFPEPRPTRACVQVAGLGSGAKIEIECLAFVD